MKRTPLKRRTGLKRKTRLKQVSLKKHEWRQLYRLKWHNEATPMMQCADCLGWFPLAQMSRHHPAGQGGANILVYTWIDWAGCHERINHNTKWARETGRLLPEFDGRKSTPETPNYFNVTLP